MTDKNIPLGIDEGEVEIVTLLDENDNEVRFELIGGYVDKGVQYFALIPEGSADEDGGFEEYIILKSVKDAEGNEELVAKVQAEIDRKWERLIALTKL